MQSEQKSDEKEFQKLPVTVLSGFLGSGKTTLLRHLLEENHGMRIAMIVNDMGAINIDANRARVVQKEAKMVQMDNGCICCTLREDLLIEIKQLAEEQKFDYLLIESTGVSEPMPVAETFTFGELHDHEEQDDPKMKQNEHAHEYENNKDESEKHESEVPTEDKGQHEHMEHDQAMAALSDIAKLDCMVTVMDAKQFFDHLQDESDVFEKWGDSEAVDEADEGTSVCTLLIDQIEFANVILLNKTDLVSPEEMNKVYATVRKLNPDAKILKTSYAKIEPKEVINTGLFDFEAAQFHAGWLKELRGQHVPETAEYGITSFVFNSRTPMSGARLQELLTSGELQSQGVIRSKGSLWLDCADDVMTGFDICGASVNVYAEQSWFVDVKNNDPEEWNNMAPEFKEAILNDFVGENGDKRQEMVIIGKDMDEQKLRGIIKSCLLTEEELAQGKDVWSKAENPFGSPEDDATEDDQEMDISGEMEDEKQGESFMERETSI